MVAKEYFGTGDGSRGCIRGYQDGSQGSVGQSSAVPISQENLGEDYCNQEGWFLRIVGRVFIGNQICDGPEVMNPWGPSSGIPLEGEG